MGKMGPVPSGCRPKWPNAALLVTHLIQPNHTPRALPWTIWGGNAANWKVFTGPNALYLIYLNGRSSLIKDFNSGQAHCESMQTCAITLHER